MKYLLVDFLHLVNGLCRFICKVADFSCHNCKTFPGFTCSGRFNGSVQCKQIRLTCYTQNTAGKFIYFFYRF
jgi:hypothetical protein